MLVATGADGARYVIGVLVALREVQPAVVTRDGSSVEGIGRDAAQQIWFRALTTYFTSGTTYAQARTATLSAARDLYGTGARYDAVAAAWSAVAVG